MTNLGNSLPVKVRQNVDQVEILSRRAQQVRLRATVVAGTYLGGGGDR